MVHPNTPQLNSGACGPDEKKRLAELVLYIAQKSADDPKFGATKLNKILYFADFYSYEKYGRSITGTQYMKLPNGPAPRLMIPVKNMLEEDGDAEEIEMMFHRFTQKRLVAKRSAKLDLFSGQDIALLDDVMDMILDCNATELSDLSHNMGWEIAGDRETIPYQSVFLSDSPASEDDKLWANHKIRETASHG